MHESSRMLIPLLVGIAMAGVDQASGLNAATVSRSRFRRRRTVFAARYWLWSCCSLLRGNDARHQGSRIIGYCDAAVPAMYVGSKRG